MAGGTLTADQARMLLGAVEGDRLAALWRLLLETGARPGEAFALRWTDVDLERGTVRIARALVRLKGGVFFAPTKTRTTRTVPIGVGLVAVLREHRRRQLEERMRLGPGREHAETLDLVLANEVGNPLDLARVSRRFKTWAKRAGLPARLRLYDLRHTATSLLLTNGVDVTTVGERMGHASIATTLKHYAHVTEASWQAASDRRAALLGGGDSRPRRDRAARGILTRMKGPRAPCTRPLRCFRAEGLRDRSPRGPQRRARFLIHSQAAGPLA
jgi:integrase